MSVSPPLKYLRKMTLEDLDEVMRVELMAYPHPWSEKNFKDCLKNNIYSCWIFELDKRAVGHVILSTVVGEAHILNICVIPEVQGKGWGRVILEEAELIAKNLKAEDCYLEVRESNTIAISLYETGGYNHIGIRKNYYPADKGREDAIVMAKVLF